MPHNCESDVYWLVPITLFKLPTILSNVYMFLHTCLDYHALVINFCVYNLILLKNFHLFNFFGLRAPTKIFKPYPNYGSVILSTGQYPGVL